LKSLEEIQGFFLCVIIFQGFNGSKKPVEREC